MAVGFDLRFLTTSRPHGLTSHDLTPIQVAYLGIIDARMAGAIVARHRWQLEHRKTYD
jgi:hypothetical protein